MGEKSRLLEVSEIGRNVKRGVEVNILAIENLNKQKLNRMFELPNNSVVIYWAKQMLKLPKDILILSWVKLHVFLALEILNLEK
jgi:hypothetical protein